ncbi:hypothetical protein PCASD_01210 [Puccinia coronata f. sp. avenae]|uniref:Uncharacterized protein n=1 Tax=Puccinia coronata f. sp. avenae TaxID=200324 RepID=A0A2N5VLT1_9BASI|nr:hypothetical protein PCASD_01210 [Puccinia coronata f. sp. avenae]
MVNFPVKMVSLSTRTVDLRLPTVKLSLISGINGGQGRVVNNGQGSITNSPVCPDPSVPMPEDDFGLTGECAKVQNPYEPGMKSVLPGKNVDGTALVKEESYEMTPEVEVKTTALTNFSSQLSQTGPTNAKQLNYEAKVCIIQTLVVITSKSSNKRLIVTG